MLCIGLLASPFTLGAFVPTPTITHTSRAIAPAAISSCAADSADLELQIVKRMQETFWAQKRARLQAETEAKLREIQEFEAREAALASAVVSVPALGASTEVAGLQAELEAERVKSAALEAELASMRVNAELNLQKTAAFWISKLNDAKSLSAAAPKGEATAAASAVAPATPDLVADVAPILVSSISLRELRSRLLSLGLSTTGLKSELVARLESAMLGERQKFKSWDSEKLVWV